MKKLTFILFLFITASASAQTSIGDTSITWYSVPCYDSVGNMYIYKKSFDHIPTQQDSLNFHEDTTWRREYEMNIQKEIEEQRKNGYLKGKERKYDYNTKKIHP